MCDDQDPIWIDDEIKNLIQRRNLLYKDYLENGRSSNDFKVLEQLNCNLNEIVSHKKEAHYSSLASQLNDRNLNPNKYWQILKSFYNDRKIPFIPPLLINNDFVNDFREKANCFNLFFSNICKPFDNASVLPNTQSSATSSTIKNIDFSKDDLINIIRSLDINKAHGFDEISTRMIKICDTALLEPLSILFHNCLKECVFPEIWKKANVVPIHKKGDKQIINNYRPISLLPVVSKIFEKIIYNNIYHYLEIEDLLSPHQSGFRSSDSCTNQLLALTH